MPISVARGVARGLGLLMSETIEIQRRTGSFVAGAWVAGSAATSTVRANVQPASGDDLRRLPEGQRRDEVMRIYTKDAVRMTTPPATPGGVGEMADLIAWGGRTYEIVEVKNWGGAFYEALMARLGD